MTVTSFTNNEVTYNTTLQSCTCPDYIYRKQKAGQPCKHMRVLEQELNETIEQAERFLALKSQYDVRELQRKAEEKRAAYVMAFDPCGLE